MSVRTVEAVALIRPPALQWRVHDARRDGATQTAATRSMGEALPEVRERTHESCSHSAGYPLLLVSRVPGDVDADAESLDWIRFMACIPLTIALPPHSPFLMVARSR